MERPLVWGLCWSLFAKNPEVALGTALFFELFWVDHIPAGTFIPPHGLFAVFLALNSLSFLEIQTSGEAVFLLCLVLPLGWLASRAEGLLRGQQNKSYNQLLQWARKGESFDPGLLIRQAVLRTMAVNLLLFVVVQYVFLICLGWLRPFWQPFFVHLPLSWACVWIAASIGPLLSLRHRIPYAVMAFAVILVGIALGFWTWFQV